MTDLKKLRALARKATPGPWRREAYRYPRGTRDYGVLTEGQTGDVRGDGLGWIAECRWRPNRAADAAFIAAADPQTVVALVAVVEALVAYNTTQYPRHWIEVCEALEPFTAPTSVGASSGVSSAGGVDGCAA